MPSQNVIEQFVSKDVMIQKILKRHIAATNEAELKRNGSFARLVNFVHESFKIHYRGGDAKKITASVKGLDSMTKDLVIPSRSGHNLASSLMVIVHYYITFLSFVFLFNY